LTAEEREAIAACLREVTVEAGASLVTQGDNAYELFVIEAGDAEVRMDDNVVRTLGAGDVFRRDRPARDRHAHGIVIATSPLRLAAMFTREFKRLDDRMPGLGKSLRDTMAERVAQTCSESRGSADGLVVAAVEHSPLPARRTPPARVSGCCAR
jgi:CRP-like cAMP-binding protein